MRRTAWLLLTCIVVDQLRNVCGWLTVCKGIDVDGEVILADKIRSGKTVDYKPWIHADEVTIHGRVIEVRDTLPEDAVRAEISSDTGKAP